MNPFEYFQQLKPQIESDETIIRNLRLYAFGDRKVLYHLGTGTTNTHYRIGKIGDLWLATREFIWGRHDPEMQKIACESYINSIISSHETGIRVPIICGGIKAESINPKTERYFLMLEDLTAGGTKEFIAKRGLAGLVDGKEVYHDFPEDMLKEEPFEYMIDDKMILLRE